MINLFILENIVKIHIFGNRQEEVEGFVAEISGYLPSPHCLWNNVVIKFGGN